MTAARQDTARLDARRQLGRFLLVGVTLVAVDFALYRILLAAGAPISPAKAVSFVVATTLSYFINRSWTFGNLGGAGAGRRFVAVYAVTLIVNVIVNALMLAIQPAWALDIEVAFVVAQGIATALNFIGMRVVVFRP